ncbi:MAG: metallophosphoesterase [Phycisphaerales bacterium]|nr:metallophosphoesterase [Phycisphaerales bacterium]
MSLILTALLSITCLHSTLIDQWHWHASGTELIPTADTPSVIRRGDIKVEADPNGIILPGRSVPFLIAPQISDLDTPLPTDALTVEAWVSIDMPTTWGGFIGAVQDNADAEKGWVLGYDQTAFTFGLASEGTDDGDGRMTYLKSDRPFEIGRWHHVAGTYDGQEMRLYMDGQLVGVSKEQTGPVLYDPTAPLAIGGYLDRNEDQGLDGRIKSVQIQDAALNQVQIEREFKKSSRLTKLAPKVDTKLDWMVSPFLTWPTSDAVSVIAETTRPAKMWVKFKPEDGSWSQMTQEEPAELHEFRLQGLRPHSKYFYQVYADVTDAHGTQTIESPLLSFRTAAQRGDAFTFVAIGDTQAQPNVVKRVSDLAYETRPNLLIHAGDLVTTGSDKSHWTGHFFPNMQPLISRVPMMPVLGNHEQDAQYYYDYMSLPEPERWYTFSYGDADFFMIDGNRDLADQSEQLAWLNRALRESDAQWKFAVLHQPPWTSDSDDYGDTFETTSNRGDLNARNITKLLDQYGVDICFSGHVHDYERTFPLSGQSVVPWDEGGVIYVTCAGGGGTLENFDPANTFFGHRKAQRHHLVYVAIHGGILEFQAIDENGQLFDVMTLDKRDGRTLMPISE